MYPHPNWFLIGYSHFSVCHVVVRLVQYILIMFAKINILARGFSDFKQSLKLWPIITTLNIFWSMF